MLVSLRRWIAPHRRSVIAVLTLSVAVSLLDMLHPVVARHIIDGVLMREGLSPARRVVEIHAAGGLCLVLILAAIGLDAVRLHSQRSLAVRLVLLMRRTLYERLLRLPLVGLQSLSSGGAFSRLAVDAEASSGLLQSGVISPAVALARILLAIAILSLLNWRLALITCAVMPGILLASMLMIRRVRPIYGQVRADAAAADSRAGEILRALRVVRVFGAESRERLRHAAGHNLAARKELLGHRYEIVLWSVWSLALAGTTLATIWIGGLLYLRGAATVGDILACQWYAMMLVNPVWRLVESYSELQKSLAATDRVMEVLRMTREPEDEPGAIPAPPVIEDLRLEHVSFTYPDGTQAVRDVCLTLPGGTVTALVGRSGAGKTTLAGLVARLLEPTSGRILLNGVDLQAVQRRGFRRLVAVVPQEVLLLAGSVHENIAYARPGATVEEVCEAARRASAHEFITRLPDGYGTPIGEHGARLSGGERQRLAIARAILADPQLLILDEATSNLDWENEQVVHQALRQLLVGRTVLLIAHRWSTLALADRVVVLDTGKVVDCLPKNDFLRGSYRRRMVAAPREPSAASSAE